MLYLSHSVYVGHGGVALGLVGQGEVVRDNMSGADKVSGKPSSTGLPRLFNFKGNDDDDDDDDEDLFEDIEPEGHGDLNEEEDEEGQAEGGQAEPQPSTSGSNPKPLPTKRPIPPRGSPPPPNGSNYTTVKGKKHTTVKYKPIGGRYSLGVTYSYHKQKPRTRPDEPKTYYLRCSFQGNKAKGDKKRPPCKARASITSSKDQFGNVSHTLVYPTFSEQHSCMPKGAQAKEIEVEVEDMRAKIYERAALNPRESPFVSREDL